MTQGNITVEDILKYAIRIENESQLFYRSASQRAIDDAVKVLLQELEAEEVKHEQRLSDILKDVQRLEISAFDRTSLEKLISTASIDNDDSQEGVLRVALEREKNTRDFYAQILTMTNLEAHVIKVFEELFAQEQGHYQRISSKLKKLSSQMPKNPEAAILSNSPEK
ncbi:MAG: ferritin family protein [Deltaproteobacteria bacterium]|nr:ferritin family protein [Deltaproteobacteria bacterium]